MVATPGIVPGENRDPLVARLAALEKTVAAMGSKTLNSATIGSGGITVSGGSIDVTNGGVTKFHTGSNQTVIRDQAGNVVISDDPNAGWGMTQPNGSIPMYVTSTTAFYLPFASASAGSNIAMYASQAPINNPRISWSWQALMATTVSASCLYTFTVTVPGHGTTTLDSITLTGSSFQSQQNFGTYVYPANYFGLRANYNMIINFINSGNTATTSYAVCPIYLYGSGQ